MRNLILWTALLSVVLAWPLAAQKVDRYWEATQRRNGWLAALDDQDWKTWIAHAGLSVAAGHLIGALPGISVHTGMRVAVAGYLLREIAARTKRRPLRFDYRYKPLDGTMDVLVPLAVVELWAWTI